MVDSRTRKDTRGQKMAEKRQNGKATSKGGRAAGRKGGRQKKNAQYSRKGRK